MFSRLRQRASVKRRAGALYEAIVAQSRLAVFYAGWGVPDTVTGRFEMLVLHLFMLQRRLTREGDAGRQLSQVLGETFVADMDTSMREMGVSDMTVPKRMRSAAGAYLGRLRAYESAVAGGEGDLIGAIERNVLADCASGAGKPADLARYAGSVMAALDGQSGEALLGGRVSLPPQAASPKGHE